MSKTAQRKRTLYAQGFHHGVTGHHFQWRKHPQLGSYRSGYFDGQRSGKTPVSFTFWQALKFIFCKGSA